MSTSYCARFTACLFSLYCRICHRCYIFTLSLREATVVWKDCDCETTIEMDVSKVTYWYEDGDDKRWPKKPDGVYAKRIYTAKQNKPYCIYALEHESTVKASSLNLVDKSKFPVFARSNEFIFPDLNQMLKRTGAEAKILKDRLDFSCVVPKQYIAGTISGGFSKLVDNVKCLCSSNADAITLDSLLQQEMSNFLSGVLSDIEGFKIVEERELNNLFCKVLTPIFREYGFHCSDTFHHNSYSVFGTSEPDLVFYKASDGSAVASTVTFPSLCMEEEDIVQSTVEYKKVEISGKHYCQAYANMIRVANDSVVESLRSGIVVKSVTVYGLLVSHSDLLCVPMKYYSNFNDAPIILHGLPAPFTELIYCVLQS